MGYYDILNLFFFGLIFAYFTKNEIDKNKELDYRRLVLFNYLTRLRIVYENNIDLQNDYVQFYSDIRYQIGSSGLLMLGLEEIFKAHGKKGFDILDCICYEVVQTRERFKLISYSVSEN